MPKVEPVNPAEPTGDGKSYLERMKRGLSNDPNANPDMAKDFADRLKKYVEEGKEINKARNEYKKVEANTRVGGVGGGGGGADMPPGFMPGKKGGQGNIDYKKGGKVKSASKRGDGCCIKGKTKGRMV